LTKTEKEELQGRGYMCEHLLCLYSMVSEVTALFNDTYPVLLNPYDEADVILFGFLEGDEERSACLQTVSQLPIKTLNTVSPVPIEGLPNTVTRYIDWDYQIDVQRFDFDLRGGGNRAVRHSVNQAEKIGYTVNFGRMFTINHAYILSRHMSRHSLDVWDYEELVSLDRFFREHDHGLLMEAYLDGRLVGYDVVDFFEDTRIMVTPMGLYLDYPRVSDFLMYENLKYARDRGYELLDVGPACGSQGLAAFKAKWSASPKYPLYVQTSALGEPAKVDALRR
jgi:hypothetical protein